MWLVSYHLRGDAQTWYYALERDVGMLTWECYNVVLCHTDDDLAPRQKAKLFVGGLPEHIRVDVEMRHPPDLQMAMYYARAFERRAATYQALSAPPQRGPRPSSRSNPSLPPPGPVVPMAGTPGGSTPAPTTTPSRFR
jgi:hypothetical protein